MPVSPLTVRPRPRGFTLVEMMFVMLVVATLATLILPNYRQSQLKAQAADVLGRVSAINVALKSYEADGYSIVPFTGPAGQAPAFLTPYVAGTVFAGPANISLQLTKTSAEGAPVLVITAGGDAEAQILLAAGAAMGPPRAVILGGGAGLLITMAD